MEHDNLYRLSCLLSHWFEGLQELIVILDELDFTTPGVRDEIAFVGSNSKLLPKHSVVTKYSPTVSSLSTEMIVGLVYGQWNPDHWHTFVSSFAHSLASLIRKQEAEVIVPSPSEKISASKLHSGLQYWKIRFQTLPCEFPSCGPFHLHARSIF